MFYLITSDPLATPDHPLFEEPGRPRSLLRKLTYFMRTVIAIALAIPGILFAMLASAVLVVLAGLAVVICTAVAIIGFTISLVILVLAGVISPSDTADL